MASNTGKWDFELKTTKTRLLSMVLKLTFILVCTFRMYLVVWNLWFPDKVRVCLLPQPCNGEVGEERGQKGNERPKAI